MINSHDETRLKRLRYRSWHRGCKETDIILGKFSDNQLPGLDASTLNTFEKLLDEEDADIWGWLTGKQAPAEYEAILKRLVPGV